MTREEAISILSREIDEDPFLRTEYREQIHEALKMAIKTLEQEPCEDEYIKVPKKALKYRTAGMVAYNAEWLKNHFDIERAVICGAQDLCEDSISRQAVNEAIYDYSRSCDVNYAQIMEYIDKIPPVNPQPKMGRWILTSDDDYEYCTCSECGYQNGENWMIGSQIKYCQECGAKMAENG